MMHFQSIWNVGVQLWQQDACAPLLCSSTTTSCSTYHHSAPSHHWQLSKPDRSSPANINSLSASPTTYPVINLGHSLCSICSAGTNLRLCLPFFHCSLGKFGNSINALLYCSWQILVHCYGNYCERNKINSYVLGMKPIVGFWWKYIEYSLFCSSFSMAWGFKIRLFSQASIVATC